MLKDLLETGHHDVFVVDEPIPYSVALMDKYVLIGGYDEEKLPRGLLETDRDEAYEWAKETYETYNKEAEPLRITHLPSISE